MRKEEVWTTLHLFIWNDKERIRVVYRGKCHVFNYPEDGPSVNEPSGSCLKNIIGKWIKQKSPHKQGSSPSLKNIRGKWVKLTSPQKQGSTPTAKTSGSTLNKTGVKSIKVGGTKGHYIYKDITCPWALQISKGKDGETLSVRTLKDDHDCLQTRTVNMLTNSFLIKDIEETIKPNSYVLIRALKD
ncbi:hypothetical protein Tco_0884025 [Tanacetum coccineum]